MKNEDLTLEFMGYRAMCHCRPVIQRRHNLRDPKIVSSEKHIDPNRPHENILDCGTLEQCYEQIFREAVNKYNAKQKRKDRRIQNYLDTILNDKRQGKHKNMKADGSRKPAYEMIIQIGNRDNRPEDEVATTVLKKFCGFLAEKYKNIIPIGIYLHNDEFSIDEETKERIYSPVHIHFDFVYVAHLGKSLKTGMELQSSMSGALAEMGFITTKGKGTAQTQFEEACRHDLQDFAEEQGMKIDRSPGEKHSHQQKPVYQQMKENEKKEQRLKEQEQQIMKNRESLNKNINIYNEAVKNLSSEIEKHKDKSVELMDKETSLIQKTNDLWQRQTELKTQEKNMQQRETMIKIKEMNNNAQRERNIRKEAELTEREKIVKAGEMPLLERKKELDEKLNQVEQKERAIIDKEKEIDMLLKNAKSVQKENEQIRKKLEYQKNDLLQDKSLFDVSSRKVEIYKQMCDEVEENNMTIDSEVSAFKSNRFEDFASRFNKFVGNIKKILTSITTELNWYKAAFKNFWNKRSQDFRNIADVMDRNNCEKFSDYNKKYHNGQLDYQIQEKNQIIQKHAIRQKQIDNDLNWDR